MIVTVVYNYEIEDDYIEETLKDSYTTEKTLNNMLNFLIDDIEWGIKYDIFNKSKSKLTFEEKDFEKLKAKAEKILKNKNAN